MELLGAVALGIMIGFLIMGVWEKIARARENAKKWAAMREIQEAMPNVYRAAAGRE